MLSTAAVATDPRDERMAELETQVAARDSFIEQLVAKVETLTARVADLEARLNQNSTKPPSSDPPGTQRPSRPSSGRQPGGQPGHKRHKRELLRPEQVDPVVELPAPEKCRRCDAALCGRPVEALRHQLAWKSHERGSPRTMASSTKTRHLRGPGDQRIISASAPSAPRSCTERPASEPSRQRAAASSSASSARNRGVSR